MVTSLLWDSTLSFFHEPCYANHSRDALYVQNIASRVCITRLTKDYPKGVNAQICESGLVQTVLRRVEAGIRCRRRLEAVIRCMDSTIPAPDQENGIDRKQRLSFFDVFLVKL
eukprot:g68215.t1